MFTDTHQKSQGGDGKCIVECFCICITMFYRTGSLLEECQCDLQSLKLVLVTFIMKLACFGKQLQWVIFSFYLFFLHLSVLC